MCAFLHLRKKERFFEFFDPMGNLIAISCKIEGSKDITKQNWGLLLYVKKEALRRYMLHFNLTFVQYIMGEYRYQPMDMIKIRQKPPEGRRSYRKFSLINIPNNSSNFVPDEEQMPILLPNSRKG